MHVCTRECLHVCWGGLDMRMHMHSAQLLCRPSLALFLRVPTISPCILHGMAMATCCEPNGYTGCGHAQSCGAQPISTVYKMWKMYLYFFLFIHACLPVCCRGFSEISLLALEPAARRSTVVTALQAFHDLQFFPEQTGVAVRVIWVWVCACDCVC